MRFQTKILLLSTSGIALTGLAIAATVLYQEKKLDAQVTAELDIQGQSECAKIAKDVYLMLRVQDQNIKKRVRSDLAVATDLLKQTGGVTLSKDTITWNAIDQLSRQAQSVTLPKMLLGNQWLGQNRDSSAESPLVDKLQSLVGSTCTIFQRMNSSGDMLRVCTNVKAADGTRAIGTFIPATNPDGSPNPVVRAVMRGETYVGRAFVVNAWYLTAYEPIYDEQRQIIGALYVGVKQEDVPELRQGIMDVVVGKTGYVYILGGSGAEKGHYIISQKGQRDGENIWDAKDADGNLFIQSIVGKAMITKNGECAFQRYPWRNQGEERARWKVAAVTYFEPWDWVIGVGAYEDDFHEARSRVTGTIRQMIVYSCLCALGAFVVCGGASLIVSRRITEPLVDTVTTMEAVAAGDYAQRLNVASKDEIGRMGAAINATLDSLITPLSDAAGYIDRISKGDIPEKIVANYRGDICNNMKNNLNQCIEAINGLIVESTALAQAAVRGELDVKADDSRFHGKYREIIRGMNGMLEGFSTPIRDIAKTLMCMAKKDFTQPVTAEYPGLYGRLRDDVNLMVGNMRDALGQITESANQFAEGSRVIAESSQTLAQAAQSQSASVQEMTASIEELARSVDAVKENANEANTVANESNSLAEQGSIAVQKSSESMGQIRNSSAQIAEIIQVISEIASQTNLLALNAAIEAARAGEHGMGFAVVADEVRKLAERSNQAAREISALIKESTGRVEEGAHLSDETSQSLKQIIQAAEATAAKIAEIATATVQQACNAKEVSKAIQIVSQATEQAATGSEQMASSSQELGAQAETLRELVSQFKV